MVKKKSVSISLFLYLCLLCSSSAYAQAPDGLKGSVSGWLSYKNGESADFVYVALKGTKHGSITDEKGFFTIDRIPGGKYTLTVHSFAVCLKEMEVEIKEGERKELGHIVIAHNVHQLNELVVLGQSTPQSLKNTVFNVKLIDKETIRKKNVTDLVGLFNAEAGVRIKNDLMLGESDIELMGSGGNHVKVLLDGIPLADRGENKQSVSQVDINQVECIEIVQGPMSVMYGTNALAGVINIITKQPDRNRERSSLSAKVRLHEETVAKEYHLLNKDGIHNESVDLKYAHKKGYYTAGSFLRNTSGGWRGTKTGRAKLWSPKDQYIYSISGGIHKTGYEIYYRLNYVDESIITPLNPSSTRPHLIPDKEYKTDRYTHILQSHYRINEKVRIDGAASYQDYKRISQHTIFNTKRGKKYLTSGLMEQGQTYYTSTFARLVVKWNPANNLCFMPGVEFLKDKLDGDRVKKNPTDAEGLTVDTLSIDRGVRDIAFYSTMEWEPLSWFKLSLGGRSVINSNFHTPPIVPSVQTKFKLNDRLDLRLSYARGYRIPSLRELYFEFRNPNHVIYGNENLKAESSGNFSGSLVWQLKNTERMRWTTSLLSFYNIFKNPIELVPSLYKRGHITYYNLGDKKTLGITLEGNFCFDKLTGSYSYAIVRMSNKFKNDKSYEGEIMDKFNGFQELSLSLSYDLLPQLNASVFYKLSGRKKEYFEKAAGLGGKKSLGVDEIKAFQWLDLNLRYKMKNNFHIHGGVKNIFNVTTQDIAPGRMVHGDIRANLLGVGRSYFVGLWYDFTI